MEEQEHPCEGCLLGGYKTKLKGSIKAPILVVCRPPSDYMAERGMVLSQDAAMVFQSFMQRHGFSREDFAFLSCIRCGYDPKQYPAKERHVIEKHCRQWVLRTIERMKPEVIVSLGADATKAVFGRSVQITKVRGLISYEDVIGSHVMPMIDPMRVHHYPQYESVFDADCATLRRFVDSGYDLDSTNSVVHGEYTFVEDLQYLIDNPPQYLSFDLETVGNKWHDRSASICTMQFCTEPGKAQMLVWDHPERPMGLRQKRKVRNQLKQILQNPGTSVFGQNLKYDRLWVQDRLGFDFRIDHDTIMLAAIVDENLLTKNQDDLVRIYVPEMAGYADAFNQKYDKSRMDLVPLDELLQYGCGDVDANFRLLDPLLSQVEEDDGLWAHYRNVSIPGINAFAHIEPRGMRIDEEALLGLESVLEQEQKELKEKLLQQVPNSIKRKHLAEHSDPEKALSFTRAGFVLDILFYHEDGFRLTPRVYTKGTQDLRDELKVPSISTKDHLPYFFDECPFTVDLAEYIKRERVLTANIKSLRSKYVTHRDGQAFIFPTYKLWVTVTGRTSCLHGDTPVTTRKGIKPAREVQVGDELWTHKGRWRPVTHLPSKPDAEMFDVHLSNGEVLTCTADHIVLLESGEWTSLRLIMEAGGDGFPIWEHTDIRLLGWAGMPDPSYRGQEVLCSSNGEGEGFRVTDSGVIGLVTDTCRASSDTQQASESFQGYAIEAIHPRGASRVYDFSVEEDHSYLACGVFSHNSADPNGQNIPKRGSIAKAYRKTFIPPPGFVLLEADLSQAELRIAADMANEPRMLRIYNERGDIHRATALVVMGVTQEEFLRLPPEEQALARFKAKAVNFGFLYGLGWRNFIVYAKTQYGVEFTEDEAKRIRKGFFSLYAALPRWHDRMRELVRRDKQVRSYSGRIRHLPMIDSEEPGIASEAERQAINSPVQEFASSLGVMALSRIDMEVDPQYLAVTGFVHDALYALTPERYLEWGAKTLKYYMESNDLEQAFGLRMQCPIVADVSFGWNGAETFEMEGLELDQPFDFDGVKGLDREVPVQEIPPVNGRIETPEYLEIYV